MRGPAVATILAVGAFLLVSPVFADSASCEELVRQGRAYESSGDQDRALSRYGEAMQVDGSCGAGYLAMGELRARTGDGREAERVLTACLERLPDMREARLARAKVRRALGRSAEAEDDIHNMVDATSAEETPRREMTLVALRVIAKWFDEDDARPAELAIWRRIQFIATRSDDTTLLKEATAMVRALVIVVGIVDPVSSPARRDAFRVMLARAAR